MWDLWWTKWHWDRFFPDFFGFPLSISFHRCSITRKRTKNNNNLRLHHRVAQEASRLRCVRSVCCGALHQLKKKREHASVESGFRAAAAIFSTLNKKLMHKNSGISVLCLLFSYNKNQFKLSYNTTYYKYCSEFCLKWCSNNSTLA
jgi:hypothetical protein